MHELHATALETRILLSIVNKWSARCLEQRLHAAGLPISSLQYGVMRLTSGYTRPSGVITIQSR